MAQPGLRVRQRHRGPQSSWQPRPQATIIRGGTGQNHSILYNDIAAAYQNALRWHIQGSSAHGDCARDICNAWSATLTTIGGNADRFLAAGIYGWQFANVGELMRGHPGFDLARFRNMMRTVFYSMNDDFLYGGDDGVSHNGGCIINYWANWDLCNMASVMAIGILCDDGTMFDRAVNYFYNGACNGSIRHAVPYVYGDQGLAQWQEAGRDQGHTVMGDGPDGRDLRDGLEPGHRPLRRREQPVHEGGAVRLQGQPRRECVVHEVHLG
ncbi:alginate lyase family protein [Nonomuraea basaltis]|uniref:alginate lyase family protein n=1 Tax=Nonomuraea basaltis TaxID=2495887 RepID=UPI001980E228|nr:alginate lyase family protein [Nonomuraea basaltis]